jgi:predicted deacetylase
MKSLVVSIHDVSPLTQTVSANILRELAAIGVEQTSLLVIPNHHHRAPIRENHGFQMWLAEEVRKGHEPVLHGYFHQRENRSDQSILSKIVTEFYTAGEGEFFDLSETEARARLERGLTELEFLPKRICGFVAPAWLLDLEAEKAVRSLGFQYTTRIGALHLFQNRPSIHARSLVWSTRANWRIWMSLRWNALLAHQVKRHDLVRVGIHPPDYSHPDVWNQIKRLITELKSDRACVSYQTFIALKKEKLQNGLTENQ